LNNACGRNVQRYPTIPEGGGVTPWLNKRFLEQGAEKEGEADATTVWREVSREKETYFRRREKIRRKKGGGAINEDSKSKRTKTITWGD